MLLTTSCFVILTFILTGCGNEKRPSEISVKKRKGERLLSQSEQNSRVDYIEFPASNIEETKKFYSEVFGWEFTDYGPQYTSFTDGRLGGGFALATEIAAGGPLVVIYATKLEEIEASIRRSGGRIVRDPFEFPGGRRFHFIDPSGNELAVWSDR
jgi:predicted enzyme related to lactoylglutathione lyase